MHILKEKIKVGYFTKASCCTSCKFALDQFTKSDICPECGSPLKVMIGRWKYKEIISRCFIFFTTTSKEYLEFERK